MSGCTGQKPIEQTGTHEHEEKLVQTARRAYAEGPPSIQYEGQASRELSTDEFIEGPQSALMYFIGQNSVLDELGIETHEISYTGLEDEDADDDSVADELEGDSATATDEDLDAWAEGLYLCRWPNGDFSVVQAESKRDALVQLDEWAHMQNGLSRWERSLRTSRSMMRAVSTLKCSAGRPASLFGTTAIQRYKKCSPVVVSHHSRVNTRSLKRRS
ncbi:MAG TPA: hypothetical protein VF283_01880 [Bryobacteraceae bacterium]